MSQDIARRILQATAPAKPAPAPAPSSTKPEWHNVDPASFSPDLRQAYDTYRDAAREAARLRSLFETAVTSAIDPADGETVAFGYKFGKLSMAIVKGERRTSRPASTILSLADFKAR